jgi:ABC-type Fe3+-hydroxamate transport system substrate-binding protein
MKNHRSRKNYQSSLRKAGSALLALVLAFALVFALPACSTDTPNTPSGDASGSSTGGSDANEAEVSFPLEIQTVYYSTSHPDEQGPVSQTIPAPPTKIVAEGSQAVDFLVYFGLEDLIYGKVDAAATSLPDSYKSIVDAIPVINETSFMTAEQIYAAADAGVDLFLTTNPSMIRESGLSMKDLNALDINYLFTFNCTFDGSQSLGSIRTSDQFFDMCRDLGTIFGVSDKVEAYIRGQKNGFKEIMSKVATAEGDKPRVEFIYYGGSTGIYANYSGQIIQEYVEMGGGTWVIPNGTSGAYSIESVLELDADIIILRTNPTPDMKFEEIAAFQELSAIKNGTVYSSLTLPWTSNSGGLFMVDTAKEVASYIHPELNF